MSRNHEQCHFPTCDNDAVLMFSGVTPEGDESPKLCVEHAQSFAHFLDRSPCGWEGVTVHHPASESDPYTVITLHQCDIVSGNDISPTLSTVLRVSEVDRYLDVVRREAKAHGIVAVEPAKSSEDIKDIADRALAKLPQSLQDKVHAERLIQQSRFN